MADSQRPGRPMTKAVRSRSSSPRLDVRKPKVRQQASHRWLMRDLSALAPPTGRRQPVPLNAIIVPSIRRAHHLRPAARLAAETGTLLVVLASRDSRIDDVTALVASTTGCRALVVEVPEGYGHDYFEYTTSTCVEFQVANANRQSDLSLKRNIGLILARLLGWTKIMYLDDDIYGIHAGQLAKVSAQLENYPVTGLVSRQYPDNSVVCHANRLSGANQDNFITGSALGVNCARDPLPFFPDIYNEDWLFFIEHAASDNLPCVGEAHQLEYKPFQDPTRAAREEFGDLLAEGLYALIDSGDRPSCATKAYWEIFAAARRSLLDEISTVLKVLATNEAIQALKSIQAAQEQAAKIMPGHCMAFLEAWRDDRSKFEATVKNLDDVDSYADALDILQLKNWRSAEFANPDLSRTPLPMQTRARATGRRSSGAGAPRNGRHLLGPVDVRPSA
jgi:hypothetical protein